VATVLLCVAILLVSEVTYWLWLRRVRRRDAGAGLRVVKLELDEPLAPAADESAAAGHRAG